MSKNGLASEALVKANTMVSHRGPDDEGYLLWEPGNTIQVLSGRDTASSTHQFFQYPRVPQDNKQWKVGLGHRRLSILDLSPHGHQPMVLSSHGLVITYNGEIFNYIEVRNELRKLGHQFQTESDTEVILHAWAQWGVESPHHFNGMFAFVLLDTKEQKIYAVRDRFGVKPLYFTDTQGYCAFASEVKQLRVLPGYQFRLNEQIAYEYLQYALIDHDKDTFDSGIHQVMPGHMVTIDIPTGGVQNKIWYSLQPSTWKGTEEEACAKFYELLKDSVKLRMRSDVPVGSALSGGLDSSTIVCLMREVFQDQGNGNHLIKTITSCQEDKKYDEWEYAEEIIRKVNAAPTKVFPSFEKLQHDLEKMMWHMDYPFGSTSQFSQWCVFEGAKQQGLTVMIDGQGADEQLAGYGGNDMALYTGLLGKLELGELFREINAYRAYKGSWPTGFVIGAFQHFMPGSVHRMLPDKFQVRKSRPQHWIVPGSNKPVDQWPDSLSKSLYQQVTRLPLPSLLRYEDRNSMAFSIESRVPFMDYRLIEFTLGLPENLVYKRGERKYILRKAFRGSVPDKILDRKDKMGFLSAEERWVTQEGKEWFQSRIETIGNNNTLTDKNAALRFLSEITSGKIKFNHSLWRIINFNLFLTNR